jgi:hypothetical protein
MKVLCVYQEDIIRDKDVGMEELGAMLYPKNNGSLTYTVKE